MAVAPIERFAEVVCGAEAEHEAETEVERRRGRASILAGRQFFACGITSYRGGFAFEIDILRESATQREREIVGEVVSQIDSLVDIHGGGFHAVGGHILAAVVADAHLPAVLH